MRSGVALLLALTLAGARVAAAQQDTTVSRPDTTARADTARRTEQHAQDSPDDRGYVIRTGDGRYRLRILGSIRTLAAFDGEGLPGTDTFSPIEIPVPDTDINNNRFSMDARQSRFGFEALAQVGKRKDGPLLFARIEADFRGQGNALRLRHAYVRVGQEWIVGQTWTTFTDATALPLTVDLDGPNSSVSLRSTQLRASRRFGADWRWAVAIESPAADVTLEDDSTGVEAYQNVPDLVAHVRQVTGTRRLQFSGVLRVISVRGETESREAFLGFGAMGSLRQALGGAFTIGAQVIAGRGISRYLTGFSGRGLDLVRDPETGSYRALSEAGGYVALEHAWAGGQMTNFIAGALLALDDDLPDDFYRSGGYLAVNHFLPVIAGARAGAELVYGTRRNVDGARGNAARIQAIFMYDF